MPRLRLRIGGLVFAPGLVPTLVMLPLLALLVALGGWQLDRAAEKRALFAAFARGEAPAVPFTRRGPGARYVRVRLSGHYLPERQFLLDNMTQDGAAGYHVLTPLLEDGGVTVLVDRGWIPVGSDRAVLPGVAIGGEARELTGRLDELPRAGITLASVAGQGWPRVVSFPKLAALETALGRPLWSQRLLLDPALPDGFVRIWQPPGLPPERHLGYALQWFGLALALLIAYLIANLERHGVRT